MKFFQRKSYDAVVKALEAKEKELNGLRVQLSVSQDAVKALTEKLEEKYQTPFAGKGVMRIAAPAPEKKRGYIMSLQKELAKYIREDGDGNIYIDVVYELD